jgi:hypothetical protein
VAPAADDADPGVADGVVEPGVCVAPGAVVVEGAELLLSEDPDIWASAGAAVSNAALNAMIVYFFIVPFPCFSRAALTVNNDFETITLQNWSGRKEFGNARNCGVSPLS